MGDDTEVTFRYFPRTLRFSLPLFALTLAGSIFVLRGKPWPRALRFPRARRASRDGQRPRCKFATIFARPDRSRSAADAGPEP